MEPFLRSISSPIGISQARSASPSHRNGRAATPRTGVSSVLLRRALSASSGLGLPGKEWGDRKTPSPPRMPLHPVPSPLESVASFGSEASDDELLPFAKRHKTGRGFLSPLARSAMGNTSAMEASQALRPPPIRTMTSLESPDLWGDVTVIPTQPGHDGVPPTPAARPATGLRLGAPHRFASVPSMSLVAPGLYIGDELSATPGGLAEHSISHVLNCTSKPNALLEGSESPAAVGYLRLDLLDNLSDLPRMQTALRTGVDFIRQAHQQGGSVLVHCHRGISRSCTLVMAYLVEALQQPAEKVFESLRAARRVCDPNLGYWCAMQEWERAVLRYKLPSRPRSGLGGARPLGTPSPRPLSRAG